MTREQALERLTQCRVLQPDAMQVLVAADIVDTLILAIPLLRKAIK